MGTPRCLNKWNDALAESWKLREDFLSLNGTKLLELVSNIAKRIIGETARAKTDIILRVAGEALRSLRSKNMVTIKVNPSDEVNLRTKAEGLNMLGVEVGELVIVGDPSITAGRRVVESDLGIIDARSIGSWHR